MNVILADELMDVIRAIEDQTARFGNVDATLGAALFISVRLDRIAVALERIAKVQESLTQTSSLRRRGTER